MSEEQAGGTPLSQPSEALKAELAALEAMLPPRPVPAEPAADNPARDCGTSLAAADPERPG